MLCEIVAAIAIAEAVVMFILPVIAPGVHGAPEAILDATLLSLIAGPVVLWRVRAAAKRASGESIEMPIAPRRQLAVVALGVLILGFIATGLTAWESHQSIKQEARTRFEQLTERLVGEAKHRVMQPRSGLAGARGVYAASKSVERDEFEAYVGSRDLIKEFPGAIGFGFIQRVNRTDVDAFIAAERADGAPDFAIKSLAAPGSPLENAPDLYVIKHCFPRERNAPIWGLDVGSDPIRREAAERAATSGQPTLSGETTLWQDGPHQRGFIFLLPVYNKGTNPKTPEERLAALTGLIYAPIILDEALAGVVDSVLGALDFEIFQGDFRTSEAKLYDFDKHLDGVQGTADAALYTGRMFERGTPVTIGGQTWTFVTSTTPAFDAEVDRTMPIIMGASGTLLSVLLSLIVWTLGTGRAQAMSLARSMTADLRAAKAQADRLGDIARRTSNAVIIADPQGRIEWVNEGFTRITGYTLDEVKGKKPGSFLNGPGTDPSVSRLMGEALRRGEGCHTEIVNYSKTGREYTLDIEIAPLRNEAGSLTGFMAIGSDITEQKRAAAELLASEAKVRAIIDASPVPMAINEQDRITFVNPAFTRTFGYELADIPTLAEWWPTAYPDESYRESVARSWNAELERSNREGDAFVPMELRVRAKNGAEIVALVGADPIVTALNETVLVSLFDITARKQAEVELKEVSDRLQLATRAGGVGTWEYRVGENKVTWDDHMFRLYGITREQFGGAYEAWRVGVHPEDQARCDHEIQQALSGDKDFDTEFRVLWPDGTTHHIRALATVQRDASGTPVRMTGTNWDITARKLDEERLEAANKELIAAEHAARVIARTDKLTGLPNRMEFRDRLERATARAKGGTFSGGAVLFLDFDRFKQINDTLGHAVGDEVLKEIAGRLRSTLRCDDAVGAGGNAPTSARLGGDEFVVLLNDVGGAAGVAAVADRLLKVFQEPYHIEGHEVYSTASIGSALIDAQTPSADEALCHADIAMYEAKVAGKGRHIPFEPSMGDRVRNRQALETDLRGALGAGQLFLVYQPIVSLETGSIESVEALIRWQHPTLGLVRPDEFIPIAEQTGLILPIGEWVLYEACRQFAVWRKDLGDAAPRSISVNLSRCQMAKPELLWTIGDALRESGLPPACLHLEVTESVVMDNLGLAKRLLKEVRATGVILAMDDFGTGYSSLATLHQIPIDILKIDKSFVAGIGRGRDFVAVLHAAAQLAHNLGMTIVAEGVETPDQVGVLQSMDCQFAQGYHFSKPLAADAVPEFLRFLAEPGERRAAA